MVAALRGRTTVFFSTHILADVERVCDTVAILDRGRILEQAPIRDLRARRRERHRLLVEVDDPQALAADAAGRAWADEVGVDENGILAISTRDLATAQRGVPELVARLGLELRRLETDEASLEDVFVDLVGSNSDRRSDDARGEPAP